MNQSLKEELADKVLDLYIARGYGRVLKSEIDSVVFHYLLLDEFNGQIDYYSIDKKKIYELSSRYKLTENRLKRYLEEDYYIYNQKESSSLTNILADIISKRNITRESLKEGKIYLNIANPIIRKQLDVKLYESGGMMDRSFNTEKIVIDVYDFLKLFDYLNDKMIINDLYKSLPSKELNKEAQKFLDKINGNTLEECIRDIAKGVLAGLLGKVGEEATEVSFKLVSTLIKSAVNRIKSIT